MMKKFRALLIFFLLMLSVSAHAEASPADTVRGYMEALKTGDYSAADALCTGEWTVGKWQMDDVMTSLVYPNMQVHGAEITVDDKGRTRVTATLDTVDIDAITKSEVYDETFGQMVYFVGWVQDDPQDEDMMAVLAYAREHCMKSEQVTFFMCSTADGWKIDMDATAVFRREQAGVQEYPVVRLMSYAGISPCAAYEKYEDNGETLWLRLYSDTADAFLFTPSFTAYDAAYTVNDLPECFYWTDGTIEWTQRCYDKDVKGYRVILCGYCDGNLTQEQLRAGKCIMPHGI